MFNAKYNVPVHEFLTCTKKDALISLYAYYVRHNLSWVALTDLAKLINTILGENSLPTSKYMFKRIFQVKDKTVIHLNCSHCNKYLGHKENFGDEKMIRCEMCNKMTSTDIKYKKNHFVTINVENQLVEKLETAINDGDYVSTNNIDGIICDVHSAKKFKEIKRSMNNSKYITLTISTDGVVVQKATKNKSLWPIQFYINEIKIDQRFKRKYMMCAAFSFGKTPDMNAYMKPFIDEINDINAKGGIKIIIGGTEQQFLVVPAIVTADSIAKCYVQGKTQFNSHFGCPYCYHPGTAIPNSKQLKYCIEDNSHDRTKEEATNDMITAYRTGEITRGFRRLSPMLAVNIIFFDIVWQFVIDKMHGADLGVARKLFSLFLDRQNRTKELVSMWL